MGSPTGLQFSGSYSSLWSQFCPQFGSRQVCVVTLVRPRAQWPQLTLATSSCSSTPSYRIRNVIEALHRAKFKFPDYQMIPISKKWGITKFNADEFENMVAEKLLISDSCEVKYVPSHCPLDKWWAWHSRGLRWYSPVCCGIVLLYPANIYHSYPFNKMLIGE